MASYNRVILMGNLTRDPELRYTPKGTAVCKIGLAINHNWTNDAGEKMEDVTFVDVDIFGRTAENVGEYMRKGKPVHVEGRLKLDTWDDKQTGKARSRLGVVAESVQFLSDGKPSAGRAAPGPAKRGGKQDPAPVEGDGPPQTDDVPF
jgi:single-strand DNA-binding protein